MAALWRTGLGPRRFDSCGPTDLVPVQLATRPRTPARAGMPLSGAASGIRAELRSGERFGDRRPCYQNRHTRPSCTAHRAWRWLCWPPRVELPELSVARVVPGVPE